MAYHFHVRKNKGLSLSGIIAAITSQLLQQGSQTAYQLNKSLVNTGVTSVTLKKQNARLLSLNEYSHLFADGKRFVTWQ